MKYFIDIRHHASAFVFALVLLTSVSACKKDGEAGTEYTVPVVKISLLGSESDEGNNPLATKQSTKGSVASSTAGPQTFKVPFGDDMIITAVLEEVDRVGNPVGDANTAVKKASSKGSNKAAIARNPLTSGVKYGMLVYDDQGNLAAEREYTHGSPSAQDTIMGLTENKTYTFVGYSINSSSDLPVINNKATLTTVETELTDQDLMIYKEDLQINSGINELKVILKHKFTEIIPTLQIATSSSTATVWNGVIKAMGQASFNQTHEKGSVKIDDNTYTWSSNLVDKPVAFPAIPTAGVTTLTAPAILLLNPTTTTGNFSINSLTVNAVTQAVDLNELKIEPGKKYNLKLTFNALCASTVNANGFFVHYVGGGSGSTAPGTLLTWPNIPNADFGFMFDVHTLDNSFNLIVNGRSIVQTKRTYQYRTRSNVPWPGSGQTVWSNWTNVTQTQAGNATTRSVSSNVSRPLFWDWTSSDLDFQHSAKAGEDFGVTNVQFANGDVYGSSAADEGYLGVTGAVQPLWNDTYWNGAPNIFNQPSPNGPIIRVQITPEGGINIFGKKTVNGVYEPMQIITTQTSRAKHFATNANGATELTDSRTGNQTHLREERVILETRINPQGIVWNSTGTNTVEVGQRIVGRTLMYVNGAGLRRVNCN